ncbi:MAG: hypothetical protein JWM11_596 [Planctomycetaceae bacterium]|nr:hypothetical protein [Planctomycetaceae bacterium]
MTVPRKALDLKIEFNARYEQASTYHNVGRVAQEQRQWEQAEQYYRKALDLKIEFNDRYEQAGTYHNLGAVAEEQREWEQAKHNFLTALSLFINYNEKQGVILTLQGLAVVWKESADAEIVSGVAEALQIPEQEATKLLSGQNSAQAGSL